MRQFVYTMFISNNRASSHLLWKENLVKHQKVSKYYEYGCSLSDNFSNKTVRDGMFGLGLILSHLFNPLNLNILDMYLETRLWSPVICAKKALHEEVDIWDYWKIYTFNIFVYFYHIFIIFLSYLSFFKSFLSFLFIFIYILLLSYCSFY